MDPAVVGVFVPIVAIVFGVGIAMLSVVLDYRKKRAIFELHHRERLAAIEKGMDVPPLPLELLQGHRAPRTAGDHLRRGLVWTFVGAAVTGAMMLERESGAYYGLIPVAVGIAQLLYYVAYARREPAPPANRG
jgi:hypothetical protein